MWVFVVGEFKQGKSSLLNALLNAPVCPVDDDIATSALTAIRHAALPTAAVVHAPDDADAPEAPRPIAIDEVASFVTEATNPGNTRNVRRVDIGLPRDVLAGGLVLVDTPGVGGLSSAHAATTLAALSTASALLFVSDASQEYSEPELAFLQAARRLCPNVICALTKTDLYPAWREIRDADEAHLANAGIDAAVVALSSNLRQAALAANDRALNAESGFPTLVRRLRDDVLGDATRLTVRAAAADVLAVANELTRQFATERAALADPGAAAELAARLTRVKEQVDHLRSQAARWQQTLADGMGDLGSDLDHDLRARFRAVISESEAAIDAGDPAAVWSEFEPWLHRRVSEDVAVHFSLLQRRADEVAALVAEHFDIELGEAGVVLTSVRPELAMSGVGASAPLEVEQTTPTKDALAALRGGYSGIAMFSMFGSMALGASVALPVLAPLGLLMGRNALADERKRQLQLRRNQAKAAVRKYVDDASFDIGKAARDAVRHAHRDLRDLFAARAEEFHRTTAEALAAAQAAVSSDDSRRTQRLRDVDAELGRIATVRDRALALSPDAAIAVAP